MILLNIATILVTITTIPVAKAEFGTDEKMKISITPVNNQQKGVRESRNFGHTVIKKFLCGIQAFLLRKHSDNVQI